MLAAFSFGSLLYFGIELIRASGGWRLRGLVAPLLTLGWVVAFFMYPLVDADAGITQWYWVSEVWSRYMIGLPASLVTAVGLFMQRAEFHREKLHAQSRGLVASAIFFGIYGLTAGLVVPRQPFWPASFINGEAFFDLIGIPVELVRTLAAVGVCIATAQVMSIFTIETARRLYQSEEERTIFRERERIARDLHDGMLQTLYGIGLGLKEMTTLLPDELTELKSKSIGLMRESSRAIADLRLSISGLHAEETHGTDLLKAMRECADQVSRISHLPISFEVEGIREDAMAEGPSISQSLQDHMLWFLREGLSNVVRHSGAEHAAVMLALEEDTLILRISDDGIGFIPAAVAQSETASEHHGLRNLAARAAQVSGTFLIESTPGNGTRLLLQVPVPEEGA